MRLLLFICLCVMQPALLAQFTGIDSQQFPTIKAYGGGAIFTNAKTSDFTVTENGIPMTKGMSVECSTAVNDPSVSVVLVIDISESMNERMSNGRTKLEWMKNGAKNFINSLVFNGTTQCAIITFNGQSYILSDFKNTARPLNEAIDSIKYGLGATNYEAPLIDPQKSAVALLKKTPTWIRRAVVFLTDGTPNQDPPVTSIITQLNQLQATLYAIALSFDASPDLRVIAEKTGGTTSIANTEDLLVNIYKDLGSKRPTTTYCWLSYIAPAGCTEASRNRNVQILYKPTNLRQTFSYQAPPQSIAAIQLSQMVLPPFPDIPPGQQATQQLTITAKHFDMTITGDASTLPANFRVSDWGGSSPPFVLPAGQSRTITIRFSQTSPRDIRSGLLRILGTPCNSDNVSLSGGAKKVVIVSPNGGETLSSCDSLLITWGGVDPIDTVRLQYSTNNGNTWELISNTATGLQHDWKPPMNGQYLFRVSARTSRFGGMVNILGSGTGIDVGNGIATNRNASSFAVIGQYEKQLGLNGQQIASTRSQDMFLGRFRDQQTLWLKTGVQFFSTYLPYTIASGKTALMDGRDDLITATDITRNVNAGRVSIILQKVSSIGNVDWSKELLGTQKSITAQSLGKDSIGNYYLIGLYDGQLSAPIKTGGTTTINAIGLRPFTLIFNDKGEYLALRDSISKGYPRFPADTSRDSLGNVYTVRSFTNTLNLPDTVFRSAGKQDIAIRVSGRIMTPADQSDAVCSVITPLLTLSQYAISLSPTQLGSTLDTLITGYLCNRSTASIILDDPIIQNAKGLSIIEPKGGTLIPGDTCIEVRYSFSPTEKGQGQATITFGNACTSVSGIVNLEGISIGASVTNQDWGMQRIQTTIGKTIRVRNTGDNDLTITGIDQVDGKVFKPTSPSSFPMQLKAQSSIDLQYDFKPIDTIAYVDSVMIKIKELSDPLIAQLKGSGGIPLFKTAGYTFAPTNVGAMSTEQANVQVRNYSTTMPLSLFNVSLNSADGDFFIINTDSLPATISGSHQYSTIIGFKPTKAGYRSCYLSFTHDAGPGPNVQPQIVDSILIEGIGISKGLLVDTVLDMGTSLTCDIVIKDLIIKNPNDQDNRIVNIIIQDLPGNSFASAFYTVSAPIVVPAKGIARIPIGFAPTVTGQVNALLTCTAEDGATYSTFLIGEGEKMPSSILINGASSPIISIIPGTDAKLDITLSTQSRLPYARIDSVFLTLQYPPSLLNLDSVSSLQSNWKTEVTSSNPIDGNATILAYPKTPAFEFPSSSLIRLHATTFLADPGNQALRLKSTNKALCIDSAIAQSGFELDEVCFEKGRIISLTNTAFSIQIEEKDISLNIPFSGYSEASIIDVSGRVIPLLQTQVRSSGTYSCTLPELPQGVYMIFAKNGPYSITKQFMIHNTSILH
ncbi:MAG: choice-of-anchor D domain-containing protein [bacterium]